MTWIQNGLYEDDLTAKIQAYSRIAANLDMGKTPFLSYFSPNLQNLNTDDGMVPYGQRTYYYQEKQHLAGQTTFNGAHNNSTTTIVLTDPICWPGMVIVAGLEAILLGASADNLTFTGCTRTYFTPAAVAHASGDVVNVFGMSYAEGQPAPDPGPISQFTVVTTATDIIMKVRRISDSARQVAQHGDEGFAKDVAVTAETLLEAKRELQARFIASDYQAPAGETTAGRMDGMAERLSASTTSLSGALPTYEDLQAGLRLIMRAGDGADPTSFACSDYIADHIHRWGLSVTGYQGSDAANMVYGANVQAIRIGGTILEIVPCRNVCDNWALIADKSKIGVGPKSADRSFFYEYLGKDGDRTNIKVVGEYTCEWACSTAHRLFTSVAFA